MNVAQIQIIISTSTRLHTTLRIYNIEVCVFFKWDLLDHDLINREKVLTQFTTCHFTMKQLLA